MSRRAESAPAASSPAVPRRSVPAEKSGYLPSVCSLGQGEQIPLYPDVRGEPVPVIIQIRITFHTAYYPDLQKSDFDPLPYHKTEVNTYIYSGSEKIFFN